METNHATDAPPQSPSIKSPRPRLRRFFRFSLRGLLLLVLVLSVWFGWQVNRAHKQRRALARIFELGGTVSFDYQVIESQSHQAVLHVDPKKEPPVPKWLSELVGEEYFREVVSVGLAQTPTSDDLWIFDDLPSVRWLWLHDTHVTDQALERIARALPGLKGLSLHNVRVTDDGLAHLSALRDLQQLMLSQNPIGDEGLKHLAPLTKMRQLLLDETRVTDAGLIHLADMHDIDEWLGLTFTQVSDKGLMHLTHLKKARNINLLRTRVTKQGGAWLSKQLPGCRVSY